MVRGRAPAILSTAGLSADAAEAVIRLGHRIELAPGERVYRQGAEVRCFGFIETGSVDLFVQCDEGGRRVRCARLTRGSVIGWELLLQSPVSVFEVSATAPTVVVAMERQSIETLVNEQPDVAIQLANVALRTVLSVWRRSNPEPPA